MFSCDKCGKCCNNLDKSIVYAELHNGNGVCKYLDENLCSIYPNRPLLCRIDDSYAAFFKSSLGISEYYRLNYEYCTKIKNNLLGGL